MAEWGYNGEDEGLAMQSFTNAPECISGLFNPGSNGTLVSVVLGVNTGGSTLNISVAIYQADTDAPEGATRLEDLGSQGIYTAGGGVTEWETWTSVGGVTLTNGKYLFIAIKANQSTCKIYRYETVKGDFLTRYSLGNEDTNPAVGWDSPCEAVTATDTTSGYKAYINYTAAAGPSIPVLAHHYRMLQGVG